LPLRRITSIGALVGAFALALPASGPAAGGAKQQGLAGHLLVAAPRMADPRFSRTVIFMVRHDASGAMGIIVNRPFEDVPIASLLDRLGLSHEGMSGSLRIHYGGPVGPGTVFVLHTPDFRGPKTTIVGNGVAVTGTADVLRALGSGKGPRRALLALSYSGWGPGQLEREIQAGAWIAVAADPALVFDGDYETKWERAMARRDFEL